MRAVWRSLRFRLTAWYCLVLLATLAGFALALYAVVRSQLLRHHDHSLVRAAQAVTSILREREDCASLTADQQARLNDIGGLILIHDVGGEGMVFYRSAESARFPLPAAMMASARIGSSEPWFDTYATSTEMVRVYSQPYSSHAGRQGLVRIMDPLGDMEEPLAAMRRILRYLAPLALLVAFAGGQWLARRALRPIDLVTSRAREIEARSLSSRLPPRTVDDELGRLVETLNQMFGRLEASFSGMQRFTADASHEMRTPLATISSTLDVVLAKNRTAGEYEAALRSVGEEVGHLRLIVDDLLLLARADAGSARVRLEELRLDRVVTEVVEFLAPLGHERCIEVPPPATEPVVVLADEPWLRQLVGNLVGNAIKFSLEGTPTRASAVEVSVRREGPQAVLMVADRGPGMSAEELPHIFERFYRGSLARAQGTGTGLGLSIAAWIAQAHGGTILAENRPEGGSVFIVRLPAVDATDGVPG